LGEVERVEPGTELLERGDQGELGAGPAPDGETAQVPGRVLAHLPEGPTLVAVEVLDGQLRVAEDGSRDLGQARAGPDGRAVHGGGQVPEEPRPSLAAAADRAAAALLPANYQAAIAADSTTST